MDNNKEDIKVINAVRRMLHKEEKHMRYLIKSKIKLNRRGIDTTFMNEMILASGKMRRHLRYRLEEYIEYFGPTDDLGLAITAGGALAED